MTIKGDEPASCMTVREHFAAMAMQGIFSNGSLMSAVKEAHKDVDVALATISTMACGIADILIAALAKDEEK